MTLTHFQGYRRVLKKKAILSLFDCKSIECVFLYSLRIALFSPADSISILNCLVLFFVVVVGGGVCLFVC